MPERGEPGERQLSWGVSPSAILSPLLSLVATVVIGALLFLLLGKDPLLGLALFFVEPLKDGRALAELSIKATPLLLIALGLSVCFRSNVWNIGAEGQFILGSVFAGGVAMHLGSDSPGSSFLVVLVAGGLGGALWAGVTAVLRDRFHASEILVSLMLVYVAEMLLGYLVYGPWKNPAGYNFPETILFAAPTRVPKLVDGYRANVGLPMALALAFAVWLFATRTYAGFQLEVFGASPPAARYAGFSERRALWTCFLISGALSGLAGALEVMGPIGQLSPHVPAGYGFSAIIVAFVGRLHPFGIVLSAVLMSLFFIGGELAQVRLGLPKAVGLVFQGLLLFSLLACDGMLRRWPVFAARPGSPLPSAALPAELPEGEA